MKALLYSVWALSGVSLAGLLLTREMGAPAAACALTLFPLFLYFDSRGRLVKIPRLENGLILLFFAGSLARFFYLKESFLVVVAEFLILFLLLKCAFKKDRKDLFQMIVLSFFVLLSASTLALDFTFLFGFAAYILAATWTLSLYTITDGPGRQELGPAEEKALFRHLRRVSWMSLSLALGFALGIFIFFPRLSLAVFQGAVLGPARRTGFTEKVTLEKSGEIFRDPSVVMRVEVRPAEAAEKWGGKIRGRALSRFDGREWSAGGGEPRRIVKDAYRSRVLKTQKIVRYNYRVLEPDLAALKSELGMELSSGSYLRQKIYLESLDSKAIFAAPWAVSVTAALPRLDISPGLALSRADLSGERTAYEALSLVERPAESRLARKSRQDVADLRFLDRGPRKAASRPLFPSVMPLDEPETAENLEIPDDPALDQGMRRIRDLAGSIAAREDDPYSKAKKIERYLQVNYSYTLDIKGMESRNPVEDFLFSSREGHCEYFASAMALMLRMEGVPARVATGFIVDEKNPAGDYYVVRSQDAHAWVEAYMGGMWLEFDPTPRARRAAGGKPSFLGTVKQRIEYLNFLWNAHVLGYDMDSQRNFAGSVRRGSSRLSSNIDGKVMRLKLGALRAFRPEPSRIQAPKIPVLLILPVLALIVFRKYLKQFIRYITGVYNNRAEKTTNFYKEFLKIMAGKGMAIKSGETPKEFAARIACMDFGRAAGDTLNFLTDSFYRTRYAGENLTEGEKRMVISALILFKETSGKIINIHLK